FQHRVSAPTCRLCHSGPEDIVHFISHCPALSSARILPPLLAASEIASSLESDQTGFAEYILGCRWIDDPPLQREIVEFIHNLHTERLRHQLALTRSVCHGTHSSAPILVSCPSVHESSHWKFHNF
ncbi:hypothetical protein GBAR_LOCUS26036, partial [Geodia barretti]